ncbi:molybdate ABC transporter substrate-binding protein [Pseudoduganella namucuonensis]|uniref:Molybdate transport system substrate-binding protein n=1 Tax=Pseudoduganella namucuonensis TaxID=1035707 RepID=A0A1I7J6L4_9BURK|nr:molybdate ABC transporter substrate-binding protein [Pseudoduganella namucuonensis]SFU80830.1 molybdate transport system substrate-binding protein [Pseudoduganella namucuonensis]
MPKKICLAAALASAMGAACAADVTVSAAASLTNAFKELSQAYEAAHPGDKVLLNFAASDALAQQIAKGAPVDVFASADQDAMDKAESRQLLAPGTRKNFVSNGVVLIVPANSALPIKSLADLKLPAVRKITMGNPAGVPIGRYAKQALEKAGLWAAVEPKLVFGASVRQSLDYVARGEVDAGFVYVTDVAAQKDKVKVALPIASDTPVTYPIAAVRTAPNTAGAGRFLAFVAAPAGQAILGKHGFGRP